MCGGGGGGGELVGPGPMEEGLIGERVREGGAWGGGGLLFRLI